MPYDEPEAGLTTPIRNRYFFGQLLGVDDLGASRSTPARKRRLANRLLHGCGVVAGLDVTLTGESGLTVSAGRRRRRLGSRDRRDDADDGADPRRRAGDGRRRRGRAVLRRGGRRPDAGDRAGRGPVEASTIREVPRIDVRPATAAPPPTPSAPFDLGPDGRAELGAVDHPPARPVALPADPSVLLARATVTADGAIDGVDIDVRPIVAQQRPPPRDPGGIHCAALIAPVRLGRAPRRPDALNRPVRAASAVVIG